VNIQTVRPQEAELVGGHTADSPPSVATVPPTAGSGAGEVCAAFPVTFRAPQLGYGLWTL
jgi:hypothetical protein